MFAYKEWNVEAVTGYKPKTTFYMDFSIADKFGIFAIKDTYKRAFKTWQYNIEYLTELVMVLNWKIWEHNRNGNEVLESVYSDLYYKASEWCMENLEGEDLQYYYQTTD